MTPPRTPPARTVPLADQPEVPLADQPAVPLADQVEAAVGSAAGLDLRDVEREAAITRLFDRHHTQLLRLAALLGADGDAEDIVAEAFCELHRRWGRLRDPDAALPYLRSVLVNLARMRVRHLQVVRRHPESPPPDVGSAEHEAVLREDQREVVAALAALPPRQREALVLRYWLDLREAEVAAAMGISAGAVKAHTARGMATLTRLLEGRR
ncbi:MAG: SigE family RNA polymerase sigma factor [Actinomycetota bacterium]